MALGRCLPCYSVIMKQNSVNLQYVLVELAIIKKFNNFNCSPLCPPPKRVSNNETACVHIVCNTDTCKYELCVYFKYQSFTWAISPEKNSFYAKID